ncbi:hypothetical protein [Streptomyces indicus]|uniref:Integral membrane protein n=1 Tax=Streptomyces indicus TaxID=417292 RepID=A0A1G9CLI6_9ACTN|nr:hypothetical protein [Streptomyces indicus]SDK52456.1 hypothetical protein SAMN05421806_108193 [Streptomyces indicus]
MAHAAPRPTGISAGGLGGSAAVKLAPVLALVYGYWAAAIERSGGPITAGNVWLGIISTVVFGALYLGVLKLAPRLPREARAFAWGAFAGVAFGWLYSQTDASVLRSVGMSGLFAAAVACAAFYRFYTTED